MQEKVYIIVVRYRQKFPSLGSRFGITRQSIVMPTRDPRDGNFCLYLTAMKDTYNPCPSLDYISITGFLFANFQTLISIFSCLPVLNISVLHEGVKDDFMHDVWTP